MRPRRAGFAATAASGTGAAVRSISLENGSRMLLRPRARKSASRVGRGTRSSPSGMPWESWPLWWVAGSLRSPEPFQEPWAPSQLPERRRNRSPFASTM
ncbi:hypothetical protein GCM10020254_72470 [Streptomyces goshikiensis]